MANLEVVQALVDRYNKKDIDLGALVDELNQLKCPVCGEDLNGEMDELTEPPFLAQLICGKDSNHLDFALGVTLTGACRVRDLNEDDEDYCLPKVKCPLDESPAGNCAHCGAEFKTLVIEGHKIGEACQECMAKPHSWLEKKEVVDNTDELPVRKKVM